MFLKPILTTMNSPLPSCAGLLSVGIGDKTTQKQQVTRAQQHRSLLLTGKLGLADLYGSHETTALHVTSYKRRFSVLFSLCQLKS